MSSLEKPRCVSEGDYLRWLEAAAIPSLRAEYVTDKITPPFCRDCTPNYADQMRRAELCDHPNIEFGIDADGFVKGFTPSPYTSVHQRYTRGRKLSRRAIAGRTHANSKAVIGVALDGSETLRFESLIAASEFFKPDRPKIALAQIWRTLQGKKCRKSAYGYTWRYIGES